MLSKVISTMIVGVVVLSAASAAYAQRRSIQPVFIEDGRTGSTGYSRPGTGIISKPGTGGENGGVVGPGTGSGSVGDYRAEKDNAAPVPAARKDSAPLLTRFEAARSCKDGIAYAYIGESAPRWSCVGDVPNRRGPVRSVNIIEPSESDIVVRRSPIWRTVETCYAKTGFEALKALTQQGDFVCAGKPGNNIFRNLTDE